MYHLAVHGNHLELLVPCNQGNWIDCTPRDTPENSERTTTFRSYLCHSLRFRVPVRQIRVVGSSVVVRRLLPENEFDGFNDYGEPLEQRSIRAVWPFASQVQDVLARLEIPESNPLFYVIEGLDARKHFHTPNGVRSQLPMTDAFEKR